MAPSPSPATLQSREHLCARGMRECVPFLFLAAISHQRVLLRDGPHISQWQSRRVVEKCVEFSATPFFNLIFIIIIIVSQNRYQPQSRTKMRKKEQKLSMCWRRRKTALSDTLVVFQRNFHWKMCLPNASLHTLKCSLSKMTRSTFVLRCDADSSTPIRYDRGGVLSFRPSTNIVHCGRKTLRIFS